MDDQHPKNPDKWRKRRDGRDGRREEREKARQRVDDRQGNRTGNNRGMNHTSVCMCARVCERERKRRGLPGTGADAIL